MSDQYQPQAEQNPSCPCCGGVMRREGADALHHGPGNYRYFRTLSWIFIDRVDQPVRCARCGYRDEVVHFITHPEHRMVDTYTLRSRLDATLF